MRLGNLQGGAGIRKESFNIPLVVHGAILNKQEASRISMPERSYRIPKCKTLIRYTRIHSDFFPQCQMNAYSPLFGNTSSKKMAKFTDKFKDFAECPGKYGVRKKSPQVLDKSFKGIVNGRRSKEFCWNKHTS